MLPLQMKCLYLDLCMFNGILHWEKKLILHGCVAIFFFPLIMNYIGKIIECFTGRIDFSEISFWRQIYTYSLTDFHIYYEFAISDILVCLLIFKTFGVCCKICLKNYFGECKFTKCVKMHILNWRIIIIINLFSYFWLYKLYIEPKK